MIRHRFFWDNIKIRSLLIRSVLAARLAGCVIVTKKIFRETRIKNTLSVDWERIRGRLATCVIVTKGIFRWTRIKNTLSVDWERIRSRLATGLPGRGRTGSLWSRSPTHYPLCYGQFFTSFFILP